MNDLSTSLGKLKMVGGIGRELKPDCGPHTLNIKVSHGHNQHEVSVPSNSTVGELKSVIAETIGLKPDTYKLLFRGKEKEDNEDLQTVGVKDNSKVVLIMEDKTCTQTSPEEVKETIVISRGCEAVAAVREEVDMLVEKVSALQAVVDSGSLVYENDIIYLTELLMRQLLKLDAIEAEGEGRQQRKMEVRRVQSFVDTMDILKSRNSNLSGNADNDVSPTTQLESFEPGCKSMNAASPMPSRAPTDMVSSTTTSKPHSTLSAASTTLSSSVPSHVPSSTKFENLDTHVPENTTGSVHEAIPLEPPSQPQPSVEISEFCPRAIKIQGERVLLKFYWDKICQKIMNTPFEELSAMEPKIDGMFTMMKEHMEDSSTLEGRLRSFFEDASDYVKAKLESIQKQTREAHERSLFLAQQDLFKVKALESEQVDMVNGLKAELLQITRQQEELMARLAELIKKEELMSSSLRKAEEDLSNIQETVVNKRENISKLVNTLYLSKQEVGALKEMEVLLEKTRRDLVAFNLFD